MSARTLLIAGAVLTAALAGPARANLITNGGFETNGGVGTGDFTGWTNPPDSGITVDTGFQYTGTYDASFGSAGTLSQTVATTAGTSYTLSFNVLDESGSNADTFTVTFGTFSATITGDNAAPYAPETFTIPGSAITGSSTTLGFTGSNQISAWNLDDVSLTANGVVAAPEPASAAILAGAGAMMAGLRKRRRTARQ